MVRFRFPSYESFRLAASVGILPVGGSRCSVFGSIETDSHAVWLETQHDKDLAAALVRLGVTLYPRDQGPELRPLLSVFELIPLVRIPGQAIAREPRNRTRFLLATPDHSAATLFGLIRRLQHTVEIRNAAEPETTPRRTWMLGQGLPDLVLHSCLAQGGAVFRELKPGCWMEDGFTHPLAESLPIPEQEEWLLFAHEPWQRLANLSEPPTQIKPARPHVRRLTIPPSGATPHQDALPSIAVHLKLQKDSSARAATLWRLNDVGPTWLESLVQALDGEMLQNLSTATFVTPQETVAWLWVERPELADSSDRLFTAASGRAYTESAEVPGLFLPYGFSLVPKIRPRVLREMLKLNSGELAVLHPTSSQIWEMERIKRAEFRPIGPRVRYLAQATQELSKWLPDESCFLLPAFTAQVEGVRSPTATLVNQLSPPSAARPALAQRRPDRPPWWGYVSQWVARSLQRFRRQPGMYYPLPQSALVTTAHKKEKLPDRIQGKLTSHHALLLGHEWNAKRLELEQKVVVDIPTLDAEARQRLWNHLAAVYSSIGHNQEAALCRLNELWDVVSPEAEATLAWWQAEVRAYRVGQTPTEWLAHRGPTAARVAAAYLFHMSNQPATFPEAIQLRQALAALVRQWEHELPLRAVWLAALGQAKLASGDILSLAKTRDRLLTRLNELGPSLDLDAPGFLRGRPGTNCDRFQTAREWLVRVREPMHRWLSQLETPGKLQWAGLDAEYTATKAYADLLWAWGFSKLGDRIRATEIEREARAALSSIQEPGVEPAVHMYLGELFSQTIRKQADQHPNTNPTVALPSPPNDELAAYAINRLRSALGIFPRQGLGLISPFGGREFLSFLGHDELGERLRNFLSPHDDFSGLSWEARRLLALDEADPTAATMPRILFALLERATLLDAHLVAGVIPQTLRAIELIPEWIRQGLHTKQSASMTYRIGKRMLTQAAYIASQFHLSASLRDLAEQLIDAISERDRFTGRIALGASSEFISALSKLGLTTQAGVLARRLLEPGRITPEKLGLISGLYLAGDDDIAWKLLDEARHLLFVRKVADDLERTELALAYTSAIQAAPAAIALGRLEEIFQRLDMLSTTGATNRYYTLSPLRLIDAMVRAAISEEATLSVGARQWLDDDELLTRRRLAADLSAALEGFLPPSSR